VCLVGVVKVAKTERKQVISENQELKLKLYLEKEKNKKLEEEQVSCGGGEVGGELGVVSLYTVYKGFTLLYANIME